MSRTLALQRELASLQLQVPQVVLEMIDSEHVRVEHEGGEGYLIEFTNGYPGPCRAIGESDFNLVGKTVAEAVSQLLTQLEAPPPKSGEVWMVEDDVEALDDDDDDDDDGLEKKEASSAKGDGGVSGPRQQYEFEDGDDDDDFEDHPLHSYSYPCDSTGSRLVDKQILAEQEAANALFGHGSVSLTPLCDNYRVLLRIDPRKCKISELTAGVWGISLKEPIVLRLLVHPGQRGTSQFLQEAVAYQGISDKESSFAPEKQLRVIVNQFMQELAAASPHAKCDIGGSSSSSSVNARSNGSACASHGSRETSAPSLSTPPPQRHPPSHLHLPAPPPPPPQPPIPGLHKRPFPSSSSSSCSSSRPKRQRTGVEVAITDPAPLENPTPSVPSQVKAMAAEKELAFQQAYLEQGFFAQLLRYLQLRLPSLHKFCAICDEPHCTPPMPQRSVCARTLCCWTYTQFGKLVSDAKTVNSSAEVNDLLVSLAISAASSERQELIFTPFPKLFDPGSEGTVALSEEMPERWNILKKVMHNLKEHRKAKKVTEGASWTAHLGTGDTSQPGNYTQLSQPMLEWLCTSIRCTIQPIPKQARLPDFRTEYQYILVSAAPEQEEEFQRLKAAHGGSSFAFHGSRTENWHSIVRNGLKNASNTTLMLCGAKFGPGIYLSPDANVSARYSHCNVFFEEPSAATLANDVDDLGREDATGNRCMDSHHMKLLAVCEVVQDSGLRKPQPDIWVAATEASVVTRFLLIYNTGRVPLINLGDPGLTNRLRACMGNFSSLLSASSS